MSEKKESKKLNPKSYTQKEYDKRYFEALENDEIAPGEILPELREKVVKK